MPGVVLLMFMSVLASVTSFNAGLLNTSRFTYAMARDNVCQGIQQSPSGLCDTVVAILGLMISP